MLKKLLLFDIDGTLLTMTSANRRILAEALQRVYGTEGSTATHNFAGKMDRNIIYEVLRHADLTDEAISARFDEAKAAYIEQMQQATVPADVQILPGVCALLEALAQRDDVLLGLLTGNFEGSGRHKLALAGINHYFSFGAFADDAEHRTELPPIALAKAYQQTGITFTNQNIVIVGDTEHDIACARVVQATAVAVATGTYSAEALQQHNPHVLFHDFSETESVLHTILQSTIN